MSFCRLTGACATLMRAFYRNVGYDVNFNGAEDG